MSRYSKRKSKLIRNLKKGDIIEVTDATRFPAINHKVTITNVQETSRSWFTNRRMWRAYFTPHLCFGSWCFIEGFSDDRIDVLGKAEEALSERA